MPYLPHVNTYLQQSSLLLQAYPNTTRITTKYSLPRKLKSRPDEGRDQKSPNVQVDTVEKMHSAREQQPPAATLTLKTFEPSAGICLKYRTNKSAEVGRLMIGLGKLAKGELIEEASAAGTFPEANEPKLEVIRDDGPETLKAEKRPGTAEGPKGKKKKGKK